MALGLNKNKPAPTQVAKPAQTAATQSKAAPAPQYTNAPAQKPPQAPTQSAGASGKPSFLKKGKAAQETFAKEEHKAEMNSANKTFRFFVPQNKEARLTFLDGNLSEGVLDIPFFYEHNINMNGKWGNFFICTQDEEPCPICEGGAQASYVGVLTVIDHSEYVSKKDGQTKKDNVKLFVAKRDTVKMLQKLALKTGGLRGQTFDVSRTGDKSPSVGNSFFPVGKYSEQELINAFKDKSKPLDYEKLLADMYLSAADLRKMGFGSSQGPIGGEAPMADSEDYSGEM